MDGSTICEGTLDGAKLDAREMSLFSFPMKVEHTGNEDTLDGRETSDADGPTGDTGAANDDERSHYVIQLPPQAHLGSLSRPPTLQFQDSIAYATSAQMTATLPSTAHQSPSRQEGSNPQCSSHSQDRPRKVPRRTLRAVALRLIGYILIPVFCIVPRAITDLVILSSPADGAVIPDSVNGILGVLNGLIGLFNALLFFSDPVLLVVWEGLWANRSWRVLRKQTRATAGSCRDRESRGSGPANWVPSFSPREVTTPGNDQIATIRCNIGRNESLPQRPSSNGRLEERLVSTSHGLDPRER